MSSDGRNKTSPETQTQTKHKIKEDIQKTEWNTRFQNDEILRALSAYIFRLFLPTSVLHSFLSFL